MRGGCADSAACPSGDFVTVGNLNSGAFHVGMGVTKNCEWSLEWRCQQVYFPLHETNPPLFHVHAVVTGDLHSSSRHWHSKDFDTAQGKLQSEFRDT